MKIRLFDVRDEVTALGPGKRYVIWTQGCPRSCDGCMTFSSQSYDGGYYEEVECLANTIIKSGKNGITISGGEPFIQAEALVMLINKVKKVRDVGVIIYTGYLYEELLASNDNYIKMLLEMCDLLIDGPYIDELNDGKNLRGSSNQRVIILTPRYKDEAKEYGKKDASVEFFVQEDKISMVGVPSKEMLKRIKDRWANGIKE